MNHQSKEWLGSGLEEDPSRSNGRNVLLEMLGTCVPEGSRKVMRLCITSCINYIKPEAT